MVAALLLLFVPLSAVLRFAFDASPLWIFATGAIGVVVLAHLISSATEEIAGQAGPAIGGLLNISFGSIAELVLAVFVLAKGHADVVRSQITGSIIGTCLLGLGLAMMVGGLTREKQTFKRERAGLLSSLLILVLIALMLPAVADFVLRRQPAGHDVGVSDEFLTLGASAVLLALYSGNMVYTLVTHRNVFSRPDDAAPSSGGPGIARPLAILVAGTVAVAFEAELVSDALESTATTLHLSPLFLGIVVLALVGTSADLFAAVLFAHRDKMGLVMDICLGSAIQIALVVAPLLAVVSWLLGHPMTLVFANPLDLFAIASTALIVNSVAGDGETTWFEGLLLVGVYVLLALAFFFVG